MAIGTEQKNIYINTFPNTLASQTAENHGLRIYFSTNVIVALCSAPPKLMHKI